MGARLALPLTAWRGAAVGIGLVALSGCPPESDAELFHVTFSFPADGEDAFPETPVRVGFSSPLDRQACDADAIVLGALDAEGRMIHRIAYTLADGDEPESYELAHLGLLSGYAHALVVQGGEAGCLSAGGARIEPFAIVFEVVPRE